MRPIVYIEWDDSQGFTGTWMNIEDIDAWAETPTRCYTIGFLMAANENTVTIAHSFHRDEAMGILSIPQCAITTLHQLTWNEDDENRPFKNSANGETP